MGEGAETTKHHSYKLTTRSMTIRIITTSVGVSCIDTLLIDASLFASDSNSSRKARSRIVVSAIEALILLSMLTLITDMVSCIFTSTVSIHMPKRAMFSTSITFY
jgi:hypothetical protein